MLDGVRGKGGLELGKDHVTKITVANFLKMIGIKLITYKNSFSLIKRLLLSKRRGKYVKYIIVTRDMANIGMLRKEVIQIISEIGQANCYVQAENHLAYHIR